MNRSAPISTLTSACLRAHAEAGDALEVREHRGARDAFSLCCLDDGARDGMFGSCFNGGDQRQHIGAGKPFGGFEIGQDGPALGQRAGLVERDDAGILQRLQRLALAEQNPHLRAASGSNHDRGRCCQPHGTWAGDDQHRHGIDQRESDRRVRTKRAQTIKVNAATAMTAGTNHKRHPVDQRLDGQLGALRFLDHADDLGEHGVGAYGGRTERSRRRSD